MQESTPSHITIAPPSLPKGGGALTGLGESLGQAGPTGLSSLSLPLPISAGRGFAPSLALGYSSGAGNGPFGTGWGCSVPAISLRTSHGTPQYQGNDTFIGPDGEVLVAELDNQGQPITASIGQYGSGDDAVTFATPYTVTRYYPRIEGAFNRLEFWGGTTDIDNFWLMHDRSGTLHLFGKTAAARIADPAQPAHTAAWLLEESVSPTGEHIWYTHQAENTDNITPAGRDCSAQRYLTQVNYGNVTASSTPFLWSDTSPPDQQSWLFTLVLDYGERGLEPLSPPPFEVPEDATWLTRTDPFSRYEYGFEVRTWRLCRQVLMFHHFPNELGAPSTLVHRLLLEYHDSPVMTQLSAAFSLAYEPDNTLKAIPPLELTYTGTDLDITQGTWTSLPAFPGLNDGQHYYLIDLYGEGLPGVLYRDSQDWRYCPPQRDTSPSAGPDAVTWSLAWHALPDVPAPQPAQLHLADINGDGHQELIVAQPGLAGYFTLNSYGQWGQFTPFTGLPVEFFSPHSQLTQLVGSGLADLVLVGPRVVRLYANAGAGFEVGLTVVQDVGISLPVAGRDARTWVGFADLLGSGQSHLVEIRVNQVCVWPSLGYGRFGTPLTLALPTPLDTDMAFDPERLFLADMDGSGTPDLVYAGQSGLQVFINQAGNSFAAPVTLAWPEGVTFDSLCQLQPADLYGVGCTGLVLTVPYMAPRHWYYHVATQKTFLLETVVNNLGAIQTLTYRSSAQFWLDEKRDTPDAVPALPLTLPLLSHTQTRDELTGNVLSSRVIYRQGVYDGREREFRGFGYLEVHDVNHDALPTGDDTPLAAPCLTRTWYHCGRAGDETSLYGTPWQGDPQAPVLGNIRWTQWDVTTQQEVNFTPNRNITWWMYRALKGMLLRSETWDADVYLAIPQGAPFSCSLSRPQVRCVQGGRMPVVMPSTLENVGLDYEQLAIDPQIHHHILLDQDAYASVLWQVNVAYPRRAQQPLTPYPSNWPADAWDNTYDAQQTVLRLDETRAAVYNLDDAQVWALGLAAQQRQNLLTAPGLPAGGISYEGLMAPGGLLDASQPRYYRGQSEVFYSSTLQPPTSLPALPYCTRTAVLDAVALEAYADLRALPEGDLTALGYVATPTLLDVTGSTVGSVWAVNGGLVTYDTADHFYCTLSQQNTDMPDSPRVTVTWDTYSLCMLTQTDNLNNTQSAEYDYRFLTPWRTVDINGNTQEVLFDARGRAVSSSHYGAENGGTPVGFGLVSDSQAVLKLTLEQAITNALAAGYTQQVATLSVTDLFRWMGTVTLAKLSPDTALAKQYWKGLRAARYITAEGAVRTAGRQWARNPAANPALPAALAPILIAAGGQPVCSVTLTADAYPGQSDQQTQMALNYADGVGRTLQQSVRVAPGKAWQRESTGEVNTTDSDANPRWAVSGRVEYDNKGQPVRQYRPYFLNAWQYVVDTSLRTQGYSDTVYRDAVGRETHTVTAAGYLRRTAYYPWFTVAEDENDTTGLDSGATS